MILTLYFARSFVKSCGCQRLFHPMNSGSVWLRCSQNLKVAGVLGPITAMCSKAFFGSSGVARAGATCPKNIPAPRPVGDACASGKNKRCGSKCGGSSCPNWTSAANWTGVKVFWMAVSLRQKKGLRRRQNQARQRHEVDGGGRRRGYSFGKPTGLGQPGGSNVPCGWWPIALTTATLGASACCGAGCC